MIDLLPEMTAVDISRWALFLDIDGTLIDIAPTPESVHVPRDLPASLDAWRSLLRGAVALISGRSLEQVDRLFHPHRFDASGTHGREWRYGSVTLLAGVGRCAEIDAVATFAENQLRAYPGVMLERKPNSLAVHYRAVPALKEAAEAVVDAMLQRLGPGFGRLAGKKVVEIIANGPDKGAAIERFMSFSVYRGRCPVYAGDDVTDESGFAAVNRLGGLSIHVGNTPTTEAKHTLPSPQAFREWLTAARRAWPTPADRQPS